MLPDRTSMLEPPTIDPLAIHPESSGKRHHQPSRPFHERKLGDQTTMKSGACCAIGNRPPILLQNHVGASSPPT
ncbi:hypothetical protein [Bradyrhizobium sp. CCBAU 11357]|uniref:hypothetical protein n=1 Tax=Bradyrhizobium sp. CCBAU 11357 TaxID=1630808 RepID=UPI002302A24C|nr:hypothetical protein [Bradyrhizobium sp. CCBAU 11357]